jgi:UDP-N-acetyl-D-glucosamine dehydrogenase
MRNYSFDLTSVDLSPDSLGRYDCVVIGTNHDEFDYSMIADHAETLVDTRGVYKQAQEHIFPA